ncbi:Uncharacterised protein [Vibrio cholerae]|nr:Uncharacterised protein [Vibrio cholerae]
MATRATHKKNAFDILGVPTFLSDDKDKHAYQQHLTKHPVLLAVLLKFAKSQRHAHP